MNNKAMTGNQLLELILIVILLIVVVSLIWRGISKPGQKMTDCAITGAKCYDVPCNTLHGDLQPTAQSCDNDPNGYEHCCLDVEAVIYKEGDKVDPEPSP